jgi:hypothetical protein
VASGEPPSYEERMELIKELWRRELLAEKAAKEKGDPPQETVRVECPKCHEQSDWPADEERMPRCAHCYLRFAEWPVMHPADVTVPEPRPARPTITQTVADLAEQVARMADALDRLEGKKRPD